MTESHEAKFDRLAFWGMKKQKKIIMSPKLKTIIERRARICRFIEDSANELKDTEVHRIARAIELTKNLMATRLAKKGKSGSPDALSEYIRTL